MSSVYIIKTSDKRMKIGVSKNIDKRMSQLQIGNGFELELIYKSNNLENAYSIEKKLHKNLEHIRTTNEWFLYSEELFLDAIEFIEEYGIVYQLKIKTKNKRFKENCDIFENAIRAIEIDTLLMKKENEDIQELTHDIYTGSRNSELAKVIINAHGEEKFLTYCKIISSLFDCGWGYDKIKTFIEQTNTKQLAG